MVRACGTVLRRRRTRGEVERALGRPGRDARLPARSVTVIVCTRDRPDDLRACLGALRDLRRPGVELLVVDNGSRDRATQAACADAGVRCVVEPQPGQTRARNRGLRESLTELVAFTDDDVVVDPRWLDHIDDPFDDPQVMAATGYIGPLELDHEAQVLFERTGGFERHGDRRLFDPQEMPAAHAAGLAGAGANMVFRRSLFEQIGGFDEDFGPGTPVRTSDDKVIFYRVLEAGYRIAYDPARVVWHRHRRDDHALRRLMRDWGTGEAAWAGHVLASRGDLHAVRGWAWWPRHWLHETARAAWRRRTRLPSPLLAAEVRGALEAPSALRSVRHRPAASAPAISPVDPEPASPAAVAVTAETPDITVAIASYNRRDRLRRVLTQLGLQAFPRERFDIVVVLDGSTDGSAEAVRALELPVPLQLIEQPNSGLASARNAGARAADRPVVVFLDDDIEPVPSFLAAHAAAHANASTPGMVMGRFPPVVGDNSWAAQNVRYWWLEHFRRKAEPGHRFTALDVVDGNSSMPVAVLRDVGWFDTRFRGGRRQDYELGVRLIAAGIALRYSADAYGDHHPDVSLRTALRNARQEGEYDAMIAVRHPHMHRQLDFVRHPLGTRYDTLRRATARLSIDATVRAADALQVTGRRTAWRQFVGLATWRLYMEGVRTSLETFGSADLLDRDPAPGHRVIVPLDAPRPLELPDPGATDLILTRAGFTLARVPATLPNDTWAWDDVVDRAARALCLLGPELEMT